ncbi:hypothetical protein SLS59_004790 [Nothophoma quercina]|uniref:Uncharacterized protein n=1 Tax=Nothophoma quercina TaxID=749835 RepID=A0ABR3RCD2_9PLEO
MAGWVFRENKVPHYQRLMQQHDGLRTWEKARGKWMIPAYKGLLYVSLGSSMYMMGRLVLVRPNLRLPLAQMTDCAQGHKTWFGKN